MYADVILPLAIELKLSYRVPVELEAVVFVGGRAVVPVGLRKQYTGIISALHNHPPEVDEIKEIIELLDDRPSVKPFQLELWQWISEYYLCTMGEVYLAAMPSGLRLSSDAYVTVKSDFQDFESLNAREYVLVSELTEKGKMSLSDVGKLLVVKSPMSFVKRMMDKGILTVHDELNSGLQPRTATFIGLADEFRHEEPLNHLLESLKRAKNQHQLMLRFLDLSGWAEGNYHEVAKSEIGREFEGAAAAIAALVKKKILISKELVISRISERPDEKSEFKDLNEHQLKAYQSIKESFQSQEVVLLHGVTSSGKTEIYIHLIQEALNRGEQVLYLLPEIALTTQIIDRLSRVFGNKVGVFHSRFTDAQRSEIWEKCLNEQEAYPIILGVRSAMFLPFQKLGLIIIDEEHEHTFKQQSPIPRYHARDTAMVLARILHAKVLLGSATPSLESFYNAASGKFGYVELKHRFSDMKMPAIQVADLRKARLKKQMRSHFTPELIKEIQLALDLKEQVILFQNRRGFAPYTLCNSCGFIPRCSRCDVSLTYHQRLNQLVCHYCGLHAQPLNTCPECNSSELEMKGFGTEKLEQDLHEIFPAAKILRLDQDTTRGKFSNERIINAFASGQVDILVGTQMVTKGLDFDNVSLVGILDADSMLSFPDFRAFERSYQLMAQVSGRAGRKRKQGKVIIQSTQIEHPVILDVVKNDYLHMALVQLKEREVFHYPPFYRVIQIIIRHKDRSIVNKAAEDMAFVLRKSFGTALLGPEFPPVSMVQNYHLKEMLLKLDKKQNPNPVKKYLLECKKYILNKTGFASVQIIFDVDPY